MMLLTDALMESNRHSARFYSLALTPLYGPSSTVATPLPIHPIPLVHLSARSLAPRIFPHGQIYGHRDNQEEHTEVHTVTTGAGERGKMEKLPCGQLIPRAGRFYSVPTRIGFSDYARELRDENETYICGERG